ncbi:MAG: hypothetical protein HY893_10610 [Deltaproteobacteria bacterium]|nr:hypothetical protein [Deltaproteobacteria bacterium]
MAESYSAERLSLFEALLKKGCDIENGRLWTLEPRQLRFKHGESIAELKVPYHMGAEDEACIENAVLALISLLMRRYEPASIEGRGDSPQVLPIAVPPLKDKTFRTDLFIADSLEKKLATAILSSTPYIDSAILAGWLGSDGHGRKFMRWASELFEKTLREEARGEGEEKTSYLALLAAINTIRKKKEKIKAYRIKGLSYERLDLVTGLAVFHALRAAMRDTLDRLKVAGATSYNPFTDALLSSSLVPRSFLSIPSNLLSVSLNPYGLNSESFEALSNLPMTFSAEALEPMEKNNALKGRPDTVEALKQQGDIARFRDEALKYLMEFELPGTEAQTILFEVYNEDRLIRNFLSDARATANLNRSLDEIKKRFINDTMRVEAISSFQDFLSGFKKSMLGGILKSSKKDLEAALPLIEGYYACRLDDHVEQYESLMRGYLADRRGEFNQNTLLEEYGRGRLYRFSVDDRPILKTLEVEEEGQLFVDMKDFTRKTLKVKEIAMAEFMKEYFYKPILSAASRYGVGTGIGTDERGITLTNLPGDAAIFSGGVTYLVSLARDIQAIIRRYREQLLRRLPPRRDEELLEDVHKSFEARKEALKQKREDLNRAFDASEPGVESRLVALGEEEHRLERTYRDEIENAIKGELEAGLYISYGAKAEVMLIESRHDISGPVKVSIGEKINEASRGTFRSPMVMAKLEMLMENEKVKKRQRLKYPFDVYIDRFYSIKMPPELDSAFEKLLTNRKASSAQAMARIMANEFLNDLKKITSGETFSNLRLVSFTTDIYNKGQALSYGALQAYIREAKGTKSFFQKTVEVRDLDPYIQEAFFFPVTTLDFWLGLESVKGSERVEVFYRSGEVIFKGFEANLPTVIYEMVNPEGDFFKALSRSHIHNWIEEAKKAHGAEAF